MANSVVKVTDVTDDMINDSLLLLVGEDGTVTPDKRTVEMYLNSKPGPTNLQIMHIDKCDPRGIDVVVDNVTYMPDNMEVGHIEDVSIKEPDVDEVARNLYNFKLDHDYTPLTSPKRDTSSPDDDELAKTLSILHGSEDEEPQKTKTPIVITVPPRTTLRANKNINIISSITIPPPSKGGSSASKSARDEKSVILSSAKPKAKAKILHTQFNTQKKTAPKSIKLVKKVVEKEESEEDSDDGNEEDEEQDEDEEFDEDFDLEMEDDDDSDFDIREEITGKKSRRTRPELRTYQKTQKTSPKVSKAKKEAKETVIKEKNEPEVPPKPELKVEKPIENDKTEKSNEKPAESKLTETSPELKPENAETKQLEKKPPKKEKKPPKPIPGDFALFSTPDIIRKVGGKEPTTPGPPETPATLKVNKVPGEQNKTPQPKPDTPNSSKPAKITHDSRSKSTTDAPHSPSKHVRHSLDGKDKEKQSNHLGTATESKSKERRDSIDKIKHTKIAEEKLSKSEHTHKSERRSSESTSEHRNSLSESRNSEAIASERRPSDPSRSLARLENSPAKSSHSRQSSESLEPIPSAEDIRAIIMNDETRTYTTNTIPIPDININNSEATSVDPQGLHLDGAGLDLDQSILDNINNDMISEDILYQVAQQLVSNTELQNAIDKGINEGVLDTSGIQEALEVHQQVSNSASLSEARSSDVIKEGTQIVRPDGRIVVIPPIERPTTRSRNKKKEDGKIPFKTILKPLDDEHVSGNELDSSGNEEEESEDDPNKLWCICNQPHNNRFMICCDTCEEWYHGKCVNITKAMGQQMEAEGKEWICLFCKDSSLKRPMAAARRIRKASRNSRASTDSNSSAKKNEKDKANFVPCVVCQKPARKSSIYCSETCILTHAHGIEKVVVFERSTGNMLTGNKAPTSSNLEQWLKEHPGYEVVRSAGKVVTTKIKAGNFTQSKLKLIKNPNNQGVSLAIQQKGINVGILKHGPKNSPQSQQQMAKTKLIKMYQKDLNLKESRVKLIQPQPIPAVRPSPATPPSKPKVVVQTTLSPVKTPKPKEPPREPKPKIPKSKPKEEPTTHTPTPQPKREDIRENVQKTIFEQLNVRLKGSEEIKLTADEVKNVSVEIEAELYKCFGDTGQKYKNKYRSLIFNIKDPKNQTLWRRICEKSISSYELVRLSPDDMASQELAKWREQEAKHQLDMIKKSEIELLNCNRQYVLKTHKGEEVLEDSRPGNKADNTEIIKSLTEGSTLDSGEKEKRDNSKERDKVRDRKNSSKHSHKDRSRDKDRKSSKERKDKDKDYKSNRSLSRDRDRDKEKIRKRSRSRSKDHSRHEKKKDKKSRSRSRDRDRDRHRKSSHKSSRHKKSTPSTTDNLDKRSKEILEQLNKIAPPVEDRLWKHVPQEDIFPGNAPADSDSDHEIPSSTVTIPTPPRSQESDEYQPTSQSSNDSKSSMRIKEVIEPPAERGLSPPPKTTSTEIWSGTINMVDVAQISITAHEVSGDCTGLGKELPKNLDIVGRISPDTVWDYIGKMRCSNSKIISLIRLNATNMEEQMPYLALYSYLSSRNRLGVVKSTNKSVKDFYILPLASQKPIPQALLPINGPGFEESRPALLLGIVVRDKRRRPYLDPLPASTPPKKARIEVTVVQTTPARSYTPPPVPPESAPTPPPPLPPMPPKVDPRLAKLTPPPLPPVPIIPELAPATLPPVAPPEVVPVSEEDEPYSPGDSDPDIVILESPPPPPVPAPSLPKETYTPIPGLGDSPVLPSTKLDIQRQMEELNKKIEMQKSEITSITKNIATSGSEIGTSALASIALPSNLQQILDSIKTIGAASSTESQEVLEKEPPVPGTHQTDLTIPLMIPKTFTRPLSAKKSDLGTDTIPLNLPTKPKFKAPFVNSPLRETEKSASVLSSLTEEDLIKKAAEMLNEEEPPKSSTKVDMSKPPPLIRLPTSKKQKLEVNLPPVPGVDD